MIPRYMNDAGWFSGWWCDYGDGTGTLTIESAPEEGGRRTLAELELEVETAEEVRDAYYAWCDSRELELEEEEVRLEG
jgi:hypothetical protein